MAQAGAGAGQQPSSSSDNPPRRLPEDGASSATLTTPTLQVSIIGDAFADIVVSGIGALPEWGGDALASQPIAMAAGGSALNTSLQLGHLVRLFRTTPQAPPIIVMHTALGDDQFGRFLREQVDSTPLVELSTAAAASSAKTGVCICLSGAQDRAFITHRGAVAAFSIAQLDRARILQSRIVHVAGFYNCPGLWPDLPALLRDCQGAFIALSPQHDASGEWGHLEGVFPSLDLFISNEAEAVAVSRRPGVAEAARFLVEKGVKNVIITLGARGAYALVQGDEAAAPSCPVAEVVDTTGAGDAFGAGVLYSLSAQLAEAEGGVKAFDWQAALRWGCAAGAHAVTKVGASAPPTGRDEIEAYLKSMP